MLMKAFLRSAKRAALLLAVCWCGPYAHAEMVTYDFTGVVTSATGAYSSLAVGSEVTGTYTLDFSNASSTQGYGTVGSYTSPWNAEAFGGTNVGLSDPAGYVFMSTAAAGGFSYKTAAVPGAYEDNTSINSDASTYDFSASETECPTSSFSSCSDSGFELESGGRETYTSNGLPIFAVANAGTGTYGYFEVSGIDNSGSEVEYNLTSLTPVPLPAGAWLMLSGLGGLGAFVRRRKASVRLRLA